MGLPLFCVRVPQLARRVSAAPLCSAANSLSAQPACARGRSASLPREQVGSGLRQFWQLFLATLSLERRWSWLSCDGGLLCMEARLQRPIAPGRLVLLWRRMWFPSLTTSSKILALNFALWALGQDASANSGSCVSVIHTGQRAEGATAVAWQQHMHVSRVRAQPEVEPHWWSGSHRRGGVRSIKDSHCRSTSRSSSSP